MTSSAGVSDVFPASVMSVATCEAGINIDYAYCGVEPGTNATFLILGGAEAGKAANIFGQALLLAGRSELKAGIPPSVVAGRPSQRHALAIGKTNRT